MKSRRLVHPRLAVPLAALLLFALAAPLAAYTIYFKDGGRLDAREKYRIEGDKAYIVLPNGTQAVYDADKIDIERTEKANVGNYGTALVVEGGEVREVPIEDVPRREQPTLQDLIARGAAGPGRSPEPARRPVAQPTAAPQPESSGPPRTTAGFIDLLAFERRPFADPLLDQELTQEFRRLEIEQVQVFQGTAAGRPLVEVTASSEASVFRAVVVAANALYQLGESYPALEAVELLLVTPGGQRAGQFTLTQEAARELMDREIEPVAFFLRYVEF